MILKIKALQEKSRINLLIHLAIVLCLMLCMVLYTSHVIRKASVANIHEIGEDKIRTTAARLDKYLETTKIVLRITADAVDYMARDGETPEEILAYLKSESEKQARHFDDKYTAVYGYVMGRYMDGEGWVPPAEYRPTERAWYRTALAAKGEAALTVPYVDAQTGDVVISVCGTLENGVDVLAMDVRLAPFQKIVSDLHIKNMGHGFIVNRQGMILAHPEAERQGGLLTDTPEGRALMAKLTAAEKRSFETKTRAGTCTVFFHPIMDQWYVVIVVDNEELFADVFWQLSINVVICIVIFLLVAFFYLHGYQKEQDYSRSLEDMRLEEQRKTYEAKAMRLEMEAAAQANQAKSSFLADMSHEIRTPITAVLGMNEMILRESLQAGDAARPDPEDFGRTLRNIGAYAANIESAGKNLLALINDILDFSKIEAGRMDIVAADYKLCSILNDVSNMFVFKAREKSLEFVVDVERTLPDGLHGDAVRVRQVLTNLLNNAVKYTGRGRVRLSVRGETEGEPAPGRDIRLILAVQDTGIGIKPDDFGKLFTEFQRADLDRNSTIEGTGLGLAITYRLLTMMDGYIQVESEYGVGSTFTAVIPQRIVSCEPVGDFQTKFERHMPTAKVRGETFRAPEARILVVDDTKMNLAVVVGLLKNTGMRIDTASGGAEAVERAAGTRYDLILMDQRMPGMDGSEALRRIRAREEGLGQDTPVICLTADAVIGARERYMTEGFTDYLAKPVDGAELEAMLMRHLPADKVTRISKKGEDAAADAGDKTRPGEAAAEDVYAPLRGIGIEPKTGLGYCGGDESLYWSLLSRYAREAGEKAAALERFFDARDWKNYAILAHALKSGSRMIGASALGDAAAALEQAANEENAEAAERGHAALMARYGETAAAIRAFRPCADQAAGDDDDDGDVLEFMPE